MSRNIFDIQKSMMNLIEMGVDDTTGEVAQTQEEFDLMYDSIEMELTTKIDNSNCLVKTLDSRLDVVDAEIKRLQKIKKEDEQTKKWITQRVDFVLKDMSRGEDGEVDYEELKKRVKEINKLLKHSKLSYRQSTTTEITNPEIVPDSLREIVVSDPPSKTKIKEYLEENELTECEFAKLQTNLNLSIK